MTFLKGDDPQHFIVIFCTVVISNFTFELNLLSNNFGTKFYFYLPSTEPKVHEDFCCSNASSMTISPFALADGYGRINRTDGSSPSLGPTCLHRPQALETLLPCDLTGYHNQIHFCPVKLVSSVLLITEFHW